MTDDIHRVAPKLRHCLPVLLGLALLVQPAGATAKPIEFPYKNATDLRGIINVFKVYAQACLRQPVSADLPNAIVPQGYRVVTGSAHLELGEHANSKNVAVLSKTGLEQGDWDGGHPFVTLTMPTDQRPEGQCSVMWKRGWDYEDGRDDIAFHTSGVFDVHVSYHLTAVLRSKPENTRLTRRKSYVGTSDWITWCWDGNFCGFTVIYNFDNSDGFEITISSRGVAR